MIILRFPVKGDYFPSDHNYGLYASLIHFNEVLRCLDWQLGTITGYPHYNGLIEIGSQSTLSIRCQLEDIAHFIDLKKITVGKWSITLNTPTIYQLEPSLSLRSRIVVIKGAETSQTITRSLLKQSQELGINGSYLIGERKTVKIRRYTVVGFEVMAQVATEKDSLILQEKGLGGKHKMGCGVFLC